MIDNKTVGQAIAKLRQAGNMTQQTLAACLNVSHQAVSKWENGATLPDVLTLLELSRMFGVTLEQLLAGDVDHRIEARSAEAAAAEKPIELKLDYADIRAKVEKAAAEADSVAEAAAGTPETEETSESEETPEQPEAGEAIDLDKVIEMAPFMSRAALDEIALKYNGKCSPRQLAKLAPFLSKECLEKLVVNCESEVNWDTLRRLAPFLRKETVDALTAAAAKGEKYTSEIGKQLKHGIKKLYNLGEQIYNEAKKSGTKKADPAEKTETAPAASRVSAARARIFERALAEEKFDWIGEHMDQLEDEALKAKIAARALELGMNDWLEEYMDGYCDHDSLDNAILNGNWDYVSGHIENADEDALALIADTAAAEGRWGWLGENIGYFADSDDARAALVNHALKAGNLGWLGENIGELCLSEDDTNAIITHAVSSGAWDWLAANADGLDGDWADAQLALKAYQAGHRELARDMIENHLDSADLNDIIKAAVEAGDAGFAADIIEYNGGDSGAVCINLARSGHLREVVAMAENLESDAIAVLLDIASEQGDWELIDQLNDLLD